MNKITSAKGSKIVKESNGNTTIQISEKDWMAVGEKAGWIKKAQSQELLLPQSEMPFSSGVETFQRGDVIKNRYGDIYIVLKVREPSETAPGAIPGLTGVKVDMNNIMELHVGMSRGKLETDPGYEKIGQINPAILSE